MLPALVGIVAITITWVLHRRSRRAKWWLGGAVAGYVLVFLLVLQTSDAPTEMDIADAYRRGDISYNAYERGRDAAKQTHTVGALIAGALTLVSVGLGFILERDARTRGRNG